MHRGIAPLVPFILPAAMPIIYLLQIQRHDGRTAYIGQLMLSTDRYVQVSGSLNTIKCIVGLLSHRPLAVNYIHDIFSATQVNVDDVLTCRAWNSDSVAKKKFDSKRTSRIYNTVP